MKKAVLIGVAVATLSVTQALAASVNLQSAPQISGRQDLSTGQNTILSHYEAIKEVKKSVVNISTSKTVTRSGGSFEDFFGGDPFFDQHFRRFFGDGQRQQNKKQVVRSLGSGVIVSNDGYIVTNNHVIEDTDEIVVTMLDNSTEFKAKVVGSDPKTDLAVIKIEAKNLTAAKFANSDDLLEGDIVFAIGNPFGVGLSVTSGIISALNKNNIGLNQYENFIQTDASINPGNSGGALVDSRGALVGINSAILSRSGGNNGIGFAIPSNMVKSIAKRLVEKGKIERGFLGVTISDLPSDVKPAYTNKEGALVTNVEANSSAQNAGIKRGDLIVKVNEKNIKGANDLKNYIGTLEIDSKVVIIFERDGVTKSVTLTLKGDTTALSDAGLIEGLELKESEKNARNAISGVLVVSVKEKSKGEAAGFVAGDIIIGVEQDEVQSIAQLSTLLKQNRAKSFIKVWVYRNGYAQLLILR